MNSIINSYNKIAILYFKFVLIIINIHSMLKESIFILPFLSNLQHFIINSIFLLILLILNNSKQYLANYFFVNPLI